MENGSAPSPPGNGKVYRAWVLELRAALKNEESTDVAVEAARSVVDKVVLTPANGELTVTLFGALAGMLAAASPQAEPRTCGAT